MLTELVEIKLLSAEGRYKPIDYTKERTFKRSGEWFSWLWSFKVAHKRPEGNSGYYKMDLLITWQDGESFRHRLDYEPDKFETNQLPDDLRSIIRFSESERIKSMDKRTQEAYKQMAAFLKDRSFSLHD